jgi:hypothetical protein
MSPVRASTRVNAPVIARLEPSPNIGGVDAVQQLGHAPARACVRVAEQPLVLVEVLVVEVRDQGCAEHERRDRAATGGVDGHRPARGVVHAVFPDQLDEVEAAALVGAFVGAIGGALEVLMRDDHADPEVLRERLQRATAVALRPWT